MNELEKRIGYSFKNRELLVTALTHSSYANEKRGKAEHYERIEFLGDSILGFVTAEFLYSHEPKIPEGRMTKLRAELVCENSLYDVACALGISRYMRLGHGEEKSGGRDRRSVLADMVESIIAAIYLDSDLEHAKRFIYEKLLNNAEIGETRETHDYKTQLQEFVQRDGECRIVYEKVSESGPDHDKTFSFRVVINGVPSGEGSGRTRKEAEQMAACRALEVLEK